MDEFLLVTIADWLINLSAGWFVAAIVVPSARKTAKGNLWFLTGNLLLGILSLLLATHIKRLLGVY